jgi:hypothetical protein
LLIYTSFIIEVHVVNVSSYVVQLEAEVEAMEADRAARRMRKEVERLEKLVEQPPRLGRHKFKPAPLQVKKLPVLSLASNYGPSPHGERNHFLYDNLHCRHFHH